MSAGRVLDEAEAHLVCRPLTPHHVARREVDAVDRRLGADRVVEPAFDPEHVAGAEVQRPGEEVGVLPVEAPLRNVEQRALPRGAGVQHEADVAAARVHVTRHAVDRDR